MRGFEIVGDFLWGEGGREGGLWGLKFARGQASDRSGKRTGGLDDNRMGKAHHVENLHGIFDGRLRDRASWGMG